MFVPLHSLFCPEAGEKKEIKEKKRTGTREGGGEVKKGVPECAGSCSPPLEEWGESAESGTPAHPRNKIRLKEKIPFSFLTVIMRKSFTGKQFLPGKNSIFSVRGIFIFLLERVYCRRMMEESWGKDTHSPFLNGTGASGQTGFLNAISVFRQANQERSIDSHAQIFTERGLHSQWR